MRLFGPNSRTSGQWRLAAWVTLAILALALRIGLRPAPADVVVLPFNGTPPNWLWSSVQNGWEWLRLRCLGPGPTVVMAANIMELKGLTASAHSLLPQPPVVRTNGMGVWVLDAKTTAALNQRLAASGAETISRPSIQSSSGIAGAMTVGSTVTLNGSAAFAGVDLESSLQVHRRQFALTSRILLTECVPDEGHPLSLRTNLALRFQARIPEAGSAFLCSDGSTGGKTIAMMLSPRIR